MAFCIPPKAAAAFREALHARKIDPNALRDMDSAERHAFFSEMLGEETAGEVNALFESKLILKDWKRGLVNWAQNVQGLSEPTRRDFLSKVAKLDRVLNPAEEREFLADLAAQKLGATVTVDEARAISQGAKQISDLKVEWNPEGITKRKKFFRLRETIEKGAWSSEDARLNYGTALVLYRRHVGDLLADANALTAVEYLKHPWKLAVAAAGATKGMVASMDVSFSLRQGLKMAITHPDLWTKAFVEQFKAAGRAFKSGDGMLAIEADVASRPNAMNGKYANAKVALNLKFEEAMPSNLPELIPLYGRLYKASEAAYNGMALRLRADYADRMIAAAERSGVDMSKAGKQAEGIGALVNSMTGRGNLGKLEAFGEATNAVFFSIKFFKSNLDVLTMHRFGTAIEAGPARSFVRREAAKNLAKIVGTTAAILYTADQLWPDSVEWDPRSANFGNIKIGNTRFNITGGMSSIVVLAARILPTMHNRQLRWGWSKSAASGKWTDLTAGKYGQQTALDMVDNFWQGKLSPGMGIIRDRLAGETYGGGPLTLKNTAFGLVTPISAQNFIETMNDPNHANLLAVLILDGLGISTNTYSAESAKRQRKQAEIERARQNRMIDKITNAILP
jgi:hypothetical protein